MEIKECYEKIGGNYQEAIKRIGKDDLLKRFCLKFLQDESFNKLKETIENKDYYEAFRAIHTLKGVCLNLSFTSLSNKSSELTEYLRNYQEKVIDDNHLMSLFLSLQEQYILTISTINELA